MQLLVEDVNGATTRDLAVATTRIGRAATCEILLSESTVSRLHATISAIGDFHALEDKGSSNGTFLNGVRIPPEQAFILRPGDRIEIAHSRITYGAASDATDASVFGSSESSSPMAELLEEAEDQADDRPVFIRALAAVAPQRGLEACLEHICDRLGTDMAAIFVPQMSGGTETIAAVPSLQRVATLAPLASSVMAGERGRIVRQAAMTAEPCEQTNVIPLRSAAAVPLLEGLRPLGALAVERGAGASLGRRDLARLAALAGQLGEVFATQCRDDQDTRFVFAS